LLGALLRPKLGGYGEELQMNRLVLVAMTFIVTLVVLQASAFAQAAAESVLLNGASSAATVKAGSHLGSALNQSSKQLAGRVEQQTQPTAGSVSPGRIKPVPKGSAKGTAPGPGPVIASIQGAATHCASTSQTASTPGSSIESATTNCKGQNGGTRATQNYKSVITLSLQK
jgi:hypothetical protein